MNPIISENQLDEWVRANQREAQGVIVDLVSNLLRVSAPKSSIRFPRSDSIEQQGFDGTIECPESLCSFVPEGVSYWEIGVNLDAKKKATDEFKRVSSSRTIEEKKDGLFVFVTPLSGRRGWKLPNQEKWIKERKKAGDWKDITIIDGTRLVEWMAKFPAISKWMLSKTTKASTNFETVLECWENTKSIGEPPPLTPSLFLCNREDVVKGIHQVYSDELIRVKIETKEPRHLEDVVSAFVQSLEEKQKVEYEGKTLIFPDEITLEEMVVLSEPHVLVAPFYLEDIAGYDKLIQKIQRNGHKLIFSGKPGGRTSPNTIEMKKPRVYEVKDALIKCGYPDERARVFAQKCEGNIPCLLRIIQDSSMKPEWKVLGIEAEIALASFIGSWHDNPSDQSAMEPLLGKRYGEWIDCIRPFLQTKSTPLRQFDKVWKMTPRYESWITLGAYILPAHLDAFEKLCIDVLKEYDPKYDLEPDQWLAAGITGVKPKYSSIIREGIVDTLALMGTYPDSLTQINKSRIEGTLYRILHGIFDEADWRLWASLNSYLPTIAESQPDTFLDILIKAVEIQPIEFHSLFVLVSGGHGGGSVLTGVYWALEGLAWNPEFLFESSSILLKLHAIDPGSNYSNRPGNSLKSFFIPWFPQTQANFEQRYSIVSALLTEDLKTMWGVALSLLPNPHQMSMNNHRPHWREWIEDDFEIKVSNGEYGRQVNQYFDLCIQHASGNFERLVDLLEEFKSLWPNHWMLLSEQLKLISKSISDIQKEAIKTQINKLLSDAKNYKHINDDGVRILNELLPCFDVDDILLKHKRLFSGNEFELYEHSGDWDQDRKTVQRLRVNAIHDIWRQKGIAGIESLLLMDTKAGEIGCALGESGLQDVEPLILPQWLDCDAERKSTTAKAYVFSKFRNAGYIWIDSLLFSSLWTREQRAHVLCQLDFSENTWLRIDSLTADETTYWKNCRAFPDDKPNIIKGLRGLLKFGRNREALFALRIVHNMENDLGWEIVHEVLHHIAENHGDDAYDSYEIQQLFKYLQSNSSIPEDLLLKLEFNFLPYFRRFDGATPVTIEYKMAADPKLFIEILGYVYVPEHKRGETISLEQEKIANHVSRLVFEWQHVPGFNKDGNFDANAFDQWTKQVEELAEKKQLKLPAQNTIGKALINTPPDSSGLWINEHVAKYLNQPHNDMQREAFRIAKYNSRGVCTYTRGREEMELAEKYAGRAKALELKGFYHFAKSLRVLSKTYEREANREKEHSPWGDDRE